MRLFFLFILLSFALPDLYAQDDDVVWTPGSKKININHKVVFAEDKDGTISFEDVSSEAMQRSFTHTGKPVLNFGFTESFHWIKFDVNNSSSEEIVLEIAHAFLPVADLYYTDDTGKVICSKSGYKIPVEEKPVKSHYQVFPLPKGIKTVYIKLLSNSHPLVFNIWEKEYYSVESSKLKMTYGFYTGFMSFIIVLSIFFAISLRNLLHLFYALVAFLYMCYAALVMDGFIVYWLNLDLMFCYVTVPAVGVAVQTAYSIVFLDLKRFAPKLSKIIWGFVLYFSLYAIARFFMPLVVVLGINTVHALISFFLMGYVGYQARKKGNKVGYYFAAAYLIYFLLVLTEATYIQTGTPPYFTGLSHTTVATFVEAFLLSFLLSKRFEWEKAESEEAKQIAQKALLEKTLENEKMVREQNIVLEQKVTERTEQLTRQSKELAQMNDEIQQQSEEISQHNEELQVINDKLEKQHQLLEELYNDMQASITYALRIQTAILPSGDILAKIFRSHFVFFRPRDIVSGDFYWSAPLEVDGSRQYVFVTADCTGHGVPGAFMSLICANLLNQTVIERHICETDAILTSLDNSLRRFLNKDMRENHDGMDCAIFVINHQSQTLSFTGAKRPLIYFQNGEMQEIKGDSKSIGGHYREKSTFSKHTISFEQPTNFYAFTDGYTDQMSSDNVRKKFMTRNLRLLIQEVQPLSLSEQGEIIKERFMAWRGQSSQLDDVLVVGFSL